MFSYKVTKPSITRSIKRARNSDSDDDLSRQISKKTYVEDDIVKQLSLFSITPNMLEISHSCDTLCSDLIPLWSPGNSEYEESESEHDLVDNEVKTSIQPHDRTHAQRILSRYNSAIPTQVTTSGHAVKFSSLNSNAHSNWKSFSFLVTAFRFNKDRKSWTKKGPLSIHLQSTLSGDSKICAHYLYGMLSTAFNFKCMQEFKRLIKCPSNSTPCSTTLKKQ